MAALVTALLATSAGLGLTAFTAAAAPHSEVKAKPRISGDRWGVTSYLIGDEKLGSATVAWELHLASSDPLLAKIRAGLSSGHLVKMLPGNWGNCTPDEDCSTDYADITNPQITQKGPKAAAIVRLSAVIDSVYDGLTLHLSNGSNPLGGPFTRWTVSVIVSGGWEITSLRGAAVERQSKKSVTVQLNKSTYCVIHMENTNVDMGGGISNSRILFNAALIAISIALALASLVNEAFQVISRWRWITAFIIGILTTYAFMAFGITTGSPQLLVEWLWYFLPSLAAFSLHRLATGRPPGWHRLAPVVLSSAVPLVITIASEWKDWEGIVFWCVIGVGVPGAVLGLLRLSIFGAFGRRWGDTTAVGCWALTGWLLTCRVLDAPSSPLAPDTTALLMQLALLASVWPLAFLLAELLFLSGRFHTRLILIALGITLWITFIFAVNSYSFGALFNSPSWGIGGDPLGEPASIMRACGLLILVIRLWNTGGERKSWQPDARFCCVGLIWIAGSSQVIAGWTIFYDWGTAAGICCATVGLLVLVPLHREPAALALQGVSRAAHARILQRWVHAQLLRDSRSDFHRTARMLLADGTLTRADFANRWAELEVPGTNGDPAARLARLRASALGSSTGMAPRDAGFRGALIAQVLALPWIIYGFLGIRDIQIFSTGEQIVLAAMHWAAIGFAYGYLYPWLRGNSPLAKAAAMTMFVSLPLEVLPTLAGAESDTRVSLGLVIAGQSVAVGLGLGLVWEGRIARAAGMTWSQVRNVRRLSQIATPVAAVLVAATTAVAATFAGSWADNVTHPEPTQVTSHPATTR